MTMASRAISAVGPLPEGVSGDCAGVPDGGCDDAFAGGA